MLGSGSGPCLGGLLACCSTCLHVLTPAPYFDPMTLPSFPCTADLSGQGASSICSSYPTSNLSLHLSPPCWRFLALPLSCCQSVSPFSFWRKHKPEVEEDRGGGAERAAARPLACACGARRQIRTFAACRCHSRSSSSSKLHLFSSSSFSRRTARPVRCACVVRLCVVSVCATRDLILHRAHLASLVI